MLRNPNIELDNKIHSGEKIELKEVLSMWSTALGDCFSSDHARLIEDAYKEEEEKE